MKRSKLPALGRIVGRLDAGDTEMVKKQTRLTLEIQEAAQDLERAGSIDPKSRDEIYALVGRPPALKVTKQKPKPTATKR